MKPELAMFKALDMVLVDEMSDATPGSGRNVANAWEIELKSGEFFLVNTHGLVAKYLDEGTKPHKITPKNGKMLRFEIKTPPVFRNAADNKAFNKNGKIFFFNRQKQVVLAYVKEGAKIFVLTRKVMHPGYEGRKFIRKVLGSQKVWNNVFKQYFKNME